MKVTYLFGAGASADALPTVAEIPRQLYEFRGLLNRASVEDKHSEAKECLLKDIDSLLSAIVNIKRVNVASINVASIKDILKSSATPFRTEFIPLHTSIDTYAKKLFILGDSDELRKLKVVLSLLFTFEQKDKAVDLRYDSFFASIIRKSAEQLPNTINVVSWNYDSQFELAYEKFLKKECRGIRKLSVHTKNLFERTSQDNARFVRTNTGNDFAIYKINGTASIYHAATGSEPIACDYPTLFDELCDKYQACLRKDHNMHVSALSFSWEDEDHGSDIPSITRMAEDAVRSTEVLVIIGYSVPFFNREVDKRILGNIKNLQKVYVQDKNPHDVIERLSGILPNSKAVPLDGVTQFHLPNELDLKN